MASSFRSPRRILIAVAIALALSGGSVGLVGLASADDGSTTIPARMAGDRFAYSTEYYGQEVVYEYRQLPLQPWKDEAGSWHVADIQSQVVSFSFFDQEMALEFWNILDASSLEPLASSPGGGGGSSSSSSALLPGFEQNETTSVQTMVLDVGTVGHLCGTINSLQGADAMSKTLQIVGDCGAIEGALSFRFAHDARWQDTPARVYQGQGDAEGINLTLASGIPYPVHVELLGNRTYDLVGYEPGSEPLVFEGSLPDATPLPGIGTASVDRYGVDLSGLDLPYPLVEGVEAARDDPSFSDIRDYMDRNPDWIIRTADFEGDNDHQQWQIEFAAPDEGINLYIQRDKASTHDAAAMLPGLEDSALGWDVSYQTSDFAVDGGDGPAIDELPEALPDPVDVTAAWQAYSETDAVPSNIGFRLPYCGFGECGGSTVYAGVATNSIHTSASSAPLNDLTREPVSSREEGVSLAYDQDMELSQIWYTVKTHERSGGPLAEPLGGGQGAQDGAGHESTLGWAPPPGKAAAGFTLASLVVAAAYYLWPLAKGTPLMGLWTRRRGGNDPLDHPVRRSLYDHIRSEPGSHYQALVRQVGKGNGTVEHHLRRLVSSGLVTSRASGGYTCYFPARGIDRRTIDAAPSLRSEGAQAVLATIQAHPGASVKDVATLTGLSPGTVTYHLRRLKEAGAVTAERDGRTVQLHAAAWVA